MSSTAPVTQPSAVSGEDRVASGGSLLRAIRDGQLPSPPAAQLLGLDLVDIRDGHVEFDFHPATRFDNGQTAVLGGILAAVLDFAVSTAVLTTLDIGTMVVTANLNVSFIRPVHPDSGTMRCVGTLIHRGHRSAFADATLTDSAGLIHVRATATCLMLTGAAHNHDGPPPVRPMDGHEPLDMESLLPHAR